MNLYQQEQKDYPAFDFIAGVDEAGRGPLAGPVVAAAVILDKTNIFPELNDSKKLSAKKRDYLYKKIIESAIAYEIVRIEQKFKVSRHALLYRLQKDKVLTLSKTKNLQKNVIQSVAVLGYDISLYKPSAVSEQKMTYGYYIKKAEELLSSKKISTGKYEELLIDAFRDDIVYGNTEAEGDEID